MIVGKLLGSVAYLSKVTKKISVSAILLLPHNIGVSKGVNNIFISPPICLFFVSEMVSSGCGTGLWKT